MREDRRADDEECGGARARHYSALLIINVSSLLLSIPARTSLTGWHLQAPRGWGV